MLIETPQELKFDRWQFDKKARAVAPGTNIAYSDYGRMGTESKSLAGKQRWVPKFAFDDNQVRQVILQIGAHFLGPSKCTAAREWNEIDRLCTERILSQSAEGLPEHEKPTVERFQRSVRAAGSYFALHTGIVLHFWRCSMDCVTVAQILDMTPAQVRAMANRMVCRARKLGFETFAAPAWSTGKKRNKKQFINRRRATIRRKLYGKPDYIEGQHCWECRVNLIDHSRNKWRCAQCLKNYNYSERVRLRRARRAEKQQKARRAPPFGPNPVPEVMNSGGSNVA